MPDENRSQRERVLEVLSDGEPHTSLELLDRAGTQRAGARVLELRRAGHLIVTERVTVNGRRRPAYRLVLVPPAAALEELEERHRHAETAALFS